LHLNFTIPLKAPQPLPSRWRLIALLHSKLFTGDPMSKYLSFVLAASLMGYAGGCATEPKSENARENLQDEAQVAVRRFERSDEKLHALLDRSVGYAIFPSVGKGGLVVGGAYGKGVLYENGMQSGYCDLSQASVGFQAGGQSYSELVVFKDPDALRKFKSGTYDLSAEASAVAIKPGASAQAEFKRGVAVFTATNAGLMYEASIAGQKFCYSPQNDMPR
jgi:lipid-binding SYLF domain-containing protein